MVPPLFVRRSARQGVNAVVFRVAAVTFDPVPFDSVRRCGGDELLPKLGILDRLLVGGAPAVPLPIVDPLCDAVANVNAVGVKLDPARPFQRFEPTDRGKQLHAIIGRQGLATGELTLLAAHAQENPPATRARVAAAGAVGEDVDFRRLGQKAARGAA